MAAGCFETVGANLNDMILLVNAGRSSSLRLQRQNDALARDVR